MKLVKILKLSSIEILKVKETLLRLAYIFMELRVSVFSHTEWGKCENLRHSIVMSSRSCVVLKQ